MAKMGVALFMTVGTGRRDQESVKSLAHGLLHAITTHRPDNIVFFGSEESKKTVESLKEQYYEEKQEELTNYEFIKIDKIDNFDECFDKIKERIEEYEDEGCEIIIDYTSGTKTMTMSAAISSVLYHKKLTLINGRRGDNGLVIPGTERVVEQNLYSAYDKLLFDDMKKSFNRYRFGEAKRILNQIIVLEDREKYERLIDAYALWDKFCHKKAFEILEGIKDERISQNKEFLGRLSNDKRDAERLKYILVDLINNANRRIEEGKYDDAVARLYRTIELIAQIKLLDYGLCDIDRKFTINDLKDKGVRTEFYERYADKKEGLKLGLRNKFVLLKDLGWDEVDNIYLENKRLKDLLKKRNNSILAHGLDSIDKKTAEELFKQVKSHAINIAPNLDELVEMGRFPKL
ncbi:MAG: CRISPR-associated protein (Cas_Cas02710) [Candidatus Methanolliviera sp. GoM_asphalt]|nr:MAG: CRISPR-associated protein (Cas_Cas02710) [Candidatus Methanolliviera sp. GoM_asphalt]